MKHVETREELIELLHHLEKEAREENWLQQGDKYRRRKTVICGEVMYDGSVYSMRYLACNHKDNFCYKDSLCQECNWSHLYIDDRHIKCATSPRELEKVIPLKATP